METNFIETYERVDDKLLQRKLDSIHTVSSIIRSTEAVLHQHITKDIVHIILKYYHIDCIHDLLNSNHLSLQNIENEDEIAQICNRKLQLCQHSFVFTLHSTSNSKYNQAIEMKKKYLTELIESFSSLNFNTENILKLYFETVAMNIFRPLPSLESVQNEAFTNGRWSHLQLVYELFIRLLTRSDLKSKILRRCVSESFIQNLIQLFSTEHLLERDYLKTILYRLYAKVMVLRKCIRKTMGEFFCCLVHNQQITAKHKTVNGVCELLQIYGSALSGYAVPLKAKHKEFAINMILPLHKCRNIEPFDHELRCCCISFTQKDAGLGRQILFDLLSYWPQDSPLKELSFIETVEEIIGVMINEIYEFNWKQNKDVCLLIVDQLIKCNQSVHNLVAERSLCMWNNDTISVLLDYQKELFWQRVIRALLKGCDHWNKSMMERIKNILRDFEKKDCNLYQQICQKKS